MIQNLSNFIYSLLLENETVIIPGFGAFISTYKPAEINADEIKPPSKEITFNPQIKNNDGLLVEIIARKAKISQPNAQKRIDKARENMLYELDKGETVILENIGNLRYNQNNEIEFTPFYNDNLLIDSFGLETINIKDSDEKITDAFSVVTVGTEEQKPEPEVIIVQETAPKDEVIQEKEPVPFVFPDFKQAEKREEEKEKKKAVWYWYLLFLIPALIGGYFLISNYMGPKQEEINYEPISKAEQEYLETPEIVPAETAPSDSLTREATVPSAEVNPAQALGNDASGYYLIGGGFKEEKNVEEFMLQLKEKGIESFVAGKKGSLILVGIEKFDSEEEAMKSLNEHFKSNPEWKVWIFKK